VQLLSNFVDARALSIVYWSGRSPMSAAAQPAIAYNPDFSEKWVLYLSPEEWRGRVTVEFREVPLCALEFAGCPVDPDVITGWVATLREGRQVPPPVVNLTPHGAYYVHDGNHRLMALRQELGPDAMVRVAVAVPRRGYRFRFRRLGAYGTYLLEAGPVHAYGVPVAAAMVASVIAVVLAAKAPNGAQEPSFAVAVGIVLICARFAGWVAGLLASALTAFLTAFFLLPPTHSLAVANPLHARELLIAALIMLLLSLAVGYRPRAGSGWRRLLH
jgi:hypothetical protein